MLSDADADPVTPRQRAMLGSITRGTARLHQLVEDVFTLAKLESSAFSPEMLPVHVAELVTSAVDAVRPSAAAGKLTLACTGPTTDLVVPGDPGQLERLLINLLSNAVKFTPEWGEIDVFTAADDGTAVIRVSDTGIGIPRATSRNCSPASTGPRTQPPAGSPAPASGSRSSGRSSPGTAAI